MQSRLRAFSDALFRNVALAIGLLVLVLIFWIGYKLYGESALTIHRYGTGFITGSTWDVVHEVYGSLAFIFGTAVSSVLALVIAVPISLGCAVFLTEIAPRWLSTPVAFLIELLAAVPSIIYGLWGFLVLCPFLQQHVNPWLEAKLGPTIPLFQGPAVLTNVLAAGLILAIMILPFVTSVTRAVLLSNRSGLKEGAYALGSNKWETIRSISLPAAKSGIVGAVILGLGRAIGETMAVVMVIGNTPQITSSLLKPAYSMPALLANQFSEAYNDPLQRSALFEIAFILFGITLVINALARLLLLMTTHGSGSRKNPRTARVIGTLRDTLSGAVQYGVPLLLGGVLLFIAVADIDHSGARALYGPVELLIYSITAVQLITHFARSSAAWKRWRDLNNVVMQLAATLCGLSVCIVLGLLLGYVVLKGAAGLNWALFTQLPKPVGVTGGGLKNAIFGTLELILIASVIGVPIGVMGGIYVSEFTESKITGIIRFAADVLNGIPSVVIGLFAYAAFVLPVKHFSALAGGIALSIIMIPMLVRTTEEIMRLVPQALREASWGLGGGRAQTIMRVVLPTARTGLVTGVMLAVARIAGETAPLIFTAFGSDQVSWKPSEPVSSLTMKIYYYANTSYDDWVSQAWAGALVLLSIIVVISLASRFATRRIKARV